MLIIENKKNLFKYDIRNRINISTLLQWIFFRINQHNYKYHNNE